MLLPMRRSVLLLSTMFLSTTCSDIETWSLSKVNQLLISSNNYPDGINHQDKQGFTALMWAAHRGHEKQVNQLIAKGADVNSIGTNKFGYTPLMLAAMESRINVELSLIMNRADIERRNHNGRTALDLAEFSNDTKAFGMILYGAARTSKYRVWEELLEVRSDRFIIKSINQIAPYVWGLSNVRITFLQWLNGKLEEFDRKNIKGKELRLRYCTKAFAYYKSKNNYNAMKLILHQTTDFIDERDEDGLTLLMKAVNDGDLKLVQMLVENGANLDLRNNQNKTAMDLANDKVEESKIQTDAKVRAEAVANFLKDAL